MGLLSVKLKNTIERGITSAHVYEYSLHNASGCEKGCSGFIKNVDNGRILYVCTDFHPFSPGIISNGGSIMYRVARNEKDYTGGHNHYTNPQEVADEVFKYLNTMEDDRFKREVRQ